MSYELRWYSVGRVLHLNLRNGLSIEEMKMINQKIVEIIDKTGSRLTVLIDVSELETGYYTVDQLRSTQQYMHHSKVDTIVVIANNKLNRLIGLLVFNLARTPFFQFDSAETAQQYLARRGLSAAPASLN